MKPYLKALWCGQICPSEDCGTQNPEIKELESLRARNADTLRKTLNPEQAEIFEQYILCETELIWLNSEDAFAQGVRCTAKLLIEALG